MVMVKASESKGGGDRLSAECDAIMLVDDYAIFPDGNDARIELNLTVMAATVADQIGKKVTKERFSLIHVPDRLCGIACALGLYPYDQWQADIKAKHDPDLPLELSVGLVFATQIRHRKWRDDKDGPYWTGRLNDARAKLQAGEEGADKEVEKCERVLAAKQGQLQIGGESGFKFGAIGDPEYDHIPLTAEDLQVFPDGLPTKYGTKRHREQAVAPPKPVTPPPAARQTVSPPTRQTQPAQSAAQPAGMGNAFL